MVEPPKEAAVVAALRSLRLLGAMDDRNDLTPLGQHLAAMPVDAQIGKMLIYGAILRCPEQTLTMAAGLSSRSIFLRDVLADETKVRLSGRYMSDHIALLKAVEGWQALRQESERKEYCQKLGLHAEGLKQLWEIRKQVSKSVVAAKLSLDHATRFDKHICVYV